jgi:hypothetical protein
VSKKIVVEVGDLVEVGDNVKGVITEDNRLVLVVDLNKNLGKTASGGSLSMASSGGFKLLLAEGLRYTLWVGRKLHKTIGKSVKRVDTRSDAAKMLD